MGPWILLTFLLAVVVIGVILLSSDSAKRKLLWRIPNRVVFEPVLADTFPELDRTKLKSYTEALEELGFQHALDYTPKADVPLPPGFGRLLIHPQHNCLAEIGQVYPADDLPTPMFCYMGSLLEDDWALSTCDRLLGSLEYVWRLPRQLWFCYTDSSPAELLAKHLHFRQQMIDHLHVALVAELTPKTYLAHVCRNQTQRRAVVRSKSYATIVAEINDFERAPKLQWLGDYARPVSGESVE